MNAWYRLLLFGTPLIIMAIWSKTCTAASNPELAAKYYQLALEAKHHEPIIYYYEQAANLGHAKAQTNLGIMLYEGINCHVDKPAGMKYLKMAAVQGIAQAQYRLGLAYIKDDLDVAALKDAQYWLEQASANGYKDAHTALGLLAEFSKRSTNNEG